MKVIYTIIFLTLVSGAFAQDVGTLNVEWKVTSSFEVETGMMTEEEGVLLTRSDQTIEWRSWDGTVIRSFQVTGLHGHWYNVNYPGMITYDVVSGGHRGSISIERTSTTCVARIMLVSDEGPLVYELTFSGVQKL